MKKIFTFVVMLFAIATLTFNRPVLAADVVSGAKIFSANCAACHAGGGNIAAAKLTLKKEALAENGKDTPEAIITQVTNGKNAMPSFKGRLQPEQIEDVAAYVLAQAAKDWK